VKRAACAGGIKVGDLAAAVAYYESLGVGPWQEYPSLEIFRGELDVPDVEAFMALRYRYCNLDNVQIQLCQPGEGPSRSGCSSMPMARGYSTWASLCRTWTAPRPMRGPWGADVDEGSAA
jgi:hypothetical protein